MSPAQLQQFLLFCQTVAPHEWLQQRRLHTPTHPVAAAVLLGFAPDDAGQWHILMTQRSSRLRSHSGQIAFPGGKCDPSDTSPAHTALREAQEETGTPPHIWHTVGTLPQLPTPSGYQITPVSAIAPRMPTLHANPSEVADIFWLPLAHALNPQHYQAYPPQPQVPALQWQQYLIWGATALILHHLAHSHCRFAPAQAFDLPPAIR